VEPHPRLDLICFGTEFPDGLGQLTTPESIRGWLSAEAAAPLRSNDEVRAAVRELLRGGGFKPTGRSKPSSEYLLKAAQAEGLPSINLAVDIGNAVSLHSGLPVSVVDAARLREPLRVGPAPAGSHFFFNASGQTIDVSGLLCLLDQAGPCANAVKDSQRTKTGATTRDTLTLIWGASRLGDHAQRAAAWYRQLLERSGARYVELPRQNG
jgi:DNA/RNA-binding domain of Phe-tRNA-synthetase-like protein